MTAEGMEEVGRIIREVNAEVVVPRWRALGEADIAMKGPYDPVTVADREAEQLLTARLAAFLPGSVVVGEEAVSDDASVLEALTGSAPVWIIDPIDGTRNFVEGSPRFSTLVALAVEGRTLASWSYQPIGDVMATARVGEGAWVNGERVSSPRSFVGMVPPPAVATPMNLWLKGDEDELIAALRRDGVDVRQYDACGIEYVSLASAGLDAMVMTWENSWDHAAGLLLVSEAGGATVTLDGSEYRLAGGNALPFIVGATAEVAERVRAVLAGARG